MTRFNPARSSLAGVPAATLQQWLTDAQAAMAQLASGAKVASASYNGKSVSYTQAQSATLQAWIALLQAQLGINPHPRRAMNVIWR